MLNVVKLSFCRFCVCVAEQLVWDEKRINCETYGHVFRLFYCVDLLQVQQKNNTTEVSTSSDASQTGGCGTGNITSSSADPVPSTSSHVDSGHPGCPGTETGNDGEETSETYLVKPLHAPLYSINPFCIPIKYLGLRQLTSSHNW